MFRAKAQQTLDLNVYIQGVAGLLTNFPSMQGPLSNQYFSGFVTDEVTVELHESTTPYALVATDYELLSTSGEVNCSFPTVPNGDYYIVVRHRNSLETWSKYPVTFNYTTNYFFSWAANAAFGDNQIGCAYGYAIFSGDINQDGGIDASDYLLLDADIQGFATGYIVTDLNGDGVADANDFTILDANIQNYVSVAKP